MATIVTHAPPDAVGTTALRRSVSWGAILAGAVAMITSQVVLNLVGVGVGVSTIDPATGDTPSASALSIGAAAWFVLTGIIASGFGGYLVGQMSGRLPRLTAGWHGFVAWAVSTLIVVYFLASTFGGILGSAVSGASSVVGGLGRTAGGAVQTAAQAAAPSLAQVNDPLGRIERQVRDGLGSQNADALRTAAVQAVTSLLTGDPAQQQQSRDRAIQALAQAQGISPDQARQQVSQYEQQYRQTVEETKKRAVEAADVAAKATSRGAFVASLALILGALAAFFAARAGGRDEFFYDRA